MRLFSYIYVLSTALLLCCTVSSVAEVFREQHLDYLDTETLEYYLTAPSADYDVAVLFYAQWCQNCHALAPMWAQIADMLHAGTTDSKLIMGLFDCEKDYEHSELCNKVGIKHYPTLVFFSFAGQRFQHKHPKHVTKFGGHWHYAEAVLDWVQAMSGLAQWHRAGWGKRLRKMLTGHKPTPAEKALPVGVPARDSIKGTSGDTGASSGTGSSSSTNAATLKELKDDNRQLSDLVTRSSAIVDSMLFPITKTGAPSMIGDTKNYTDVFSLLTQTKGWTSKKQDDQVLRTCTMEVALDYCGRLYTHMTEDWLQKFDKIEDISEEKWDAFQPQMTRAVNETEPFCSILEDCIITDYQDEKCRPDHCPFTEKAACRYLSACLTEEIQEEYELALFPKKGSAKEETTKNKGAWGIPK